MEVQARSRHRGLANMNVPFWDAVVHQRLVPVDLKVGDDANLARARLELPCQIDGDRARESGRKPHVADYALPTSIWLLRLEIGSLHCEIRLTGGIHRVRSEVLGKSVQQEMQRTRRVPLSEIENERVRFGEAGEVEQLEPGHVMVIVLAQRRKHILAEVVPRPR